MRHPIRIVVQFCLLLHFLIVQNIAAAGVGLASLRYPYCARAHGMGDVGYALADDDGALFSNPAGLALSNSRWSGGAVCASEEAPGSLYGNGSIALAYQDSRLKNIGWSAYINRWSGFYDQMKELTLAAGGGYSFFSNRVMTHAGGVSVKYFRSHWITHLDSIDESGKNQVLFVDVKGTALSFDLGYLLELFKKVRIGISLRNAGPGIWYRYIDTTINEAMLPLSLALGIGFKDEFGTPELAILDIATELFYSREQLGSMSTDNLAAGIELLFLHSLAFRAGCNTEGVSFGFGARLFNHFECDFFRITSKEWIPENVRYGWSVSFTRALNWRKSDLTWWRRGN